jgi:hypothetical protein
MKTCIFIDNNVWDILFDHKVDLTFELPTDEFEVRITREAEFEFPGMPAEKQEYAQKMLTTCAGRTDKIFGFYDPRHSPEEQRCGGFGDNLHPEVGGRLAERPEVDFIAREAPTISQKKKRTGLFGNEADVSLAARSIGSVVLTCDNGVLGRARRAGGRVIDIKEWGGTIPFGAFIRQEIATLEVSDQNQT